MSPAKSPAHFVECQTLVAYEKKNSYCYVVDLYLICFLRGIPDWEQHTHFFQILKKQKRPIRRDWNLTLVMLNSKVAWSPWKVPSLVSITHSEIHFHEPKILANFYTSSPLFLLLILSSTLRSHLPPACHYCHNFFSSYNHHDYHHWYRLLTWLLELKTFRSRQKCSFGQSILQSRSYSKTCGKSSHSRIPAR